MIILALSLLVHFGRVLSLVDPLLLTGVSTNTDTTYATFVGSNLNSVSTLAIQKSEFSPNYLSVVLALQAAGQAAQLRLFDKSGALHLNSNVFVMQSVQSMAFATNSRIFLFDRLENSFGVYEIQFGAGVFSMNELLSVVAGSSNVPGKASAVFSDSLAGCIFVWGTDAAKQIFKVETGSPFTASSSTSNINALRSAYGMFEQTADMLVAGMLNTLNLAYFKKTSLKIDFTLTRDCQAVAGTTDDEDSNVMIERWVCSANNPLVKFDLSNRNALTRTSPDISLPDTSYTRVHNIGKYRYLALLTTASFAVRRLQLVYKSNFTLATHAQLTINQFVVDQSNLGFEVQYDMLYFGLVATSASNSNFHSYRLEMDRCRTRVSGVCTECDLNWYLAPDNSCISQADFPANSGWDPVSKTVKPCAQSTCISCLADYRLCSKCDPLQNAFLNLSSSACVVKHIQDGWGFKSGTTQQCTQTDCAKCHEDFDVCTECAAFYELSGIVCRSIGCGAGCSLCEVAASTGTCRECSPSYRLFGNQCIFTAVTLSIAQVGSSLRFSVSKSSYIDQIKDKLAVSIDLLDDSQSLLHSVSSFTIGLDASFGSLIIELEEPQDSPNLYRLSIRSQEWIFVPEQNVGVNGFNQTFRMIKTGYQKMIEAAGDRGQQLSTFSDIQTNSAATSSVVLLLASLDPSGLLIRLIQSMKMQSRLWYINISYGERLHSFLFNLEKSSKSDAKSRAEYQAKMSSYRGKLSRRTINLSLYGLQFYQYLVGWVGLGAIFVATRFRKLPKWGLIAVYYFMKFRLIVFNSILIDFVWTIGHLLLHARRISAWDSITLFAVLCGILADCSQIFYYTYDNKVWLEYFNRKFNPNHPRQAFNRNTRDSKPMIDYKTTYSNIFSNHHILFQTASLLNNRKVVYGGSLFRVRYLYQVGKIILYQLLILSCQYCTLTALCLMFSLEICYICLVLGCYARHHHLKHMFFLSMELSQPLLLFLYLLMCLVIYSKVSPPEVYQDMGIWLVIVSCIVEYFLLVAFVCVTVYVFCKNKKSQKSHSKAPSTAGSNWLFISYLEPPSPHCTSQPENERIIKRENSIPDSQRLQDLESFKPEAKLEYIPKIEEISRLQGNGVEELTPQYHSDSNQKKSGLVSIFPRLIHPKPFHAVKSRGSLKATPPALESLSRALHRGSLFSKSPGTTSQARSKRAEEHLEQIEIDFDTKQDEPHDPNLAVHFASEPKLEEEQEYKDNFEPSETPTMPHKNHLSPKVPSKFPLHKKILVKRFETETRGVALTTTQDPPRMPPTAVLETGDLHGADEIQSIDIG